MKKKKNRLSRNSLLLIGLLVASALAVSVIGVNNVTQTLSSAGKAAFAAVLAPFKTSSDTLSALRAQEIYVGKAYNANGCKNEFKKGTRTPYDVIPVKRARVTSLDGYTPLAYYGLSSVQLDIPAGYTAFIGKKGSSSSSLIDVGWTLTKKDGTSCINLGSYNDQATGILVAPKCSVIAYGGYNATGKFTAEVERLVNAWKLNNKEKDVLVITRKGFDKASMAGQSAYNDMSLVLGENSQNTLAIFHSISSIGAFNYGIKSDSSKKVKVYLWDPPYNGWYLKLTPNFFNENVKEIKKAVAASPNIVASPDIVNITKGKSTEPAHSDETKLAPIVNAWLDANCIK